MSEQDEGPSERIERQLRFLTEIDRLKTIERQSVVQLWRAGGVRMVRALKLGRPWFGLVVVYAMACSCALRASAQGVPESARSRLERDRNPRVGNAERARFADDNRGFAFDLYARASASPTNICFSPYSISMALAMTHAGARGETAREVAKAMHFGLSGATLHAAFNASDLALQGRATEHTDTTSGFALQIANAAFAQKGLRVENRYLDLLASRYGSGLFLADFAQDPEHERVVINAWVSQRTQQRIRDLFPAGSLEPLTRLVLVNTISFKASWSDTFDVRSTRDGVFHAPNGDVRVPMMYESRRNQYARGAGFQALELPYTSPAVRMLVILPDAGQLAAIEAHLSAAFFRKVLASLSTQPVALTMPRFKFSAGLELISHLQALGMRRAFQERGADFSGIAGEPGELYVSQIRHQAFIAVDEQGTEAAAATGVGFRGRSALLKLIEVKLDRPFIFIIHDEPTGQILFLGRVTEPHAP